MPDERAPSPLRLLAPAALALFAVALLLVLTSSGTDGDSDRPAAQERRAADAEPKPRPKPQPRRPSYTVKTGDTLAAIAQKNDVSIERLQELNPELDPQALVSGQKIKLRE